MKVIVGIDPGVGGYITSFTAADNKILDLKNYPMPKYQHRTRNVVDAAALAALFKEIGPDKIYLEEVHSMPRDSKVGAFAFGRSFECPQSVAATLGIPLELITPQRWQKTLFGVKQGKDEKKSISWCKRNLPGINLRRTERCTTDDDNLADSVCIAIYGAKAEGWIT